MKSRNLKYVASAALFFAFAALSHATASFHNSGTTANGGGFSNWDSSNLDSPDSITQSTSVLYPGTSSSIKCQTNYQGTGYTGRYHAMKRHNSGYVYGDTGFYGFAFYLQSAWDFSGSQQYQLFQMIANFAGDSQNTCGEDSQPSAMIWVSGNQLASRRNYGSDECHRTTQSYTGLATVSAGVWHRIVTQAHWTNDSTGYYKVWFDGTKVLELLNQAVTVNRPTQYTMDVGIYANSWHDQGFCTGSTQRIAWFSKVGKGTVFADADPAQW
jgi:hypothetical protein